MGDSRTASTRSTFEFLMNPYIVIFARAYSSRIPLYEEGVGSIARVPLVERDPMNEGEGVI